MCRALCRWVSRSCVAVVFVSCGVIVACITSCLRLCKCQRPRFLSTACRESRRSRLPCRRTGRSHRRRPTQLYLPKPSFPSHCLRVRIVLHLHETTRNPFSAVQLSTPVQGEPSRPQSHGREVAAGARTASALDAKFSHDPDLLTANIASNRFSESAQRWPLEDSRCICDAWDPLWLSYESTRINTSGRKGPRRSNRTIIH